MSTKKVNLGLFYDFQSSFDMKIVFYTSLLSFSLEIFKIRSSYSLQKPLFIFYLINVDGSNLRQSNNFLQTKNYHSPATIQKSHKKNSKTNSKLVYVLQYKFHSSKSLDLFLSTKNGIFLIKNTQFFLFKKEHQRDPFYF